MSYVNKHTKKQILCNCNDVNLSKPAGFCCGADVFGQFHRDLVRKPLGRLCILFTFGDRSLGNTRLKQRMLFPGAYFH